MEDRKDKMGKAITKSEIDRMARQGGENEVRASEDYNRQMANNYGKSITKNEMKRSAPRKNKR
jgi:hypothetical protein